MTLAAVVICLLVSAVAMVGVVSPPHLLGILRKILTPRGLILMSAFRVVLGAVLVFSAASSKAPEFIAIVGVIVIVRGVILPIIGVERVRKLLDYWSAQGSGLLRGWALLAAAIGLWVAYAVLP